MNTQNKKIVLAGGRGFLGQLLIKSFATDNLKHELVVLSRGGALLGPARLVPWNGYTLSEWAKEIDGADVVINLTGQNVKCLYTNKNLEVLRESRVQSTQVIGQAIRQAKKPPSLWIQMSSASIYAHSFDSPHKEETGKIGETMDVPPVWHKISKLVQDWEQAFYSAQTENTRKVLIRSGVVMGLKKGGAFDIFLKLCRWGLGGPIGSGKQMVSWIHELDFVRAMHFLMDKPTIKGPLNMCSPYPLTQAKLMQTLREEIGMKWGLPATKWMVQLSAYLTGIDSELSLKSRYVVPKVLVDQGFSFRFPKWKEATTELVSRWRKTTTKL